MTKSGELFLRCNNLTLDKYKLLALSRGLTGAVGFTVSLLVLVVILIAARRKAWNTLSKRLFLMTILYTAAYSVVVTAGVHYSHPPTNETAYCEAMAFLLHYSGSLVIVSYLFLALTLALQVVLPVFPALVARMERTFSNKRLWEVILFLTCFLVPILSTVEPLLLPIDPYGKYGPLCWFRLEIDENCSHSNLLYKNEQLLWTLPFGLMSFSLFTLGFFITIILCCIYRNFRKTRTGSGLKKAIRQTLTLTIPAFVCVAWFIAFLLQKNKQHKRSTFSTWTQNVTLTPIAVTGVMLLVALSIHFPLRLLYNCWKRSISKVKPQSQAVTERATVRSSEWDHRNVPSVTVTHIRHETVTTSQLINEQKNYLTFTDGPTWQKNCANVR